MSDDLLVYEPRAFWEVLRVDTSVANIFDAITVANRRTVVTPFDRENFRNGTRNPIELTHVLLTGVGYAFDEFDGQNTPPSAVGDFDACLAAIQKTELFVKTPDKRNFGIRPGRSSGLIMPDPNGNVRMRQDPTFDYSAPLHGVTRWTFPTDKPMIIPRGGIVEFQLGSPLSQPFTSGIARANYRIGFFEGWGLTGGSARTKSGALVFVNSTTQPNHPFEPADGLGSVAQGQTAIFPPAQHFTRTEWRAQQQTQAGSTVVRGFAVAIDQAQHDDDINDAGGSFANQPIAPLATRTPVGIARQFGSGSGAQWWRPGIPLALLGPTLGDALSYELPKPITLYPGDALDLELTTPVGVSGQEGPIFPIYQIGVSFLGMASIAG